MMTLDLGFGHTASFFAWCPDRDLNPQDADRPDIDRAGLFVAHPDPAGGECKSAIHFDLPGAEHLADGGHRWTVESWEPLTVAPSLLCRRCGDHGFIRDGRWVPA